MTGQEILGGIIFVAVLAGIVLYILRKKKDEKPGMPNPHPLPRKNPKNDI